MLAQRSAMRYTLLVSNAKQEQVMQAAKKLTVLHKHTIAMQMRNDIAAYAANILAKEASTDALAMYANDVADASTALAQFVKTSNTQMLYKTLVCCDTDVREHYYKVLQYIANNKLVPEYAM